MNLPLIMDSVYHIWIPLSLDSIPLKVRFLHMEADAEVMALRCDLQQGNQRQEFCLGQSQAGCHVKICRKKQR